MDLDNVKNNLDSNDINSLIYWQQYIYPFLDLTETDYFEDDEVEEILELYDFIMEKIAWQYINQYKFS